MVKHNPYVQIHVWIINLIIKFKISPYGNVDRTFVMITQYIVTGVKFGKKNLAK